MVGMPAPREWLTGPNLEIIQSDREVIALLRQTALDINRMLRRLGATEDQGIGAIVRREQLLLVKRELKREEAQLWEKLGDKIKARRARAAARVIGLGKDMNNHLLGTVGGLVEGAQIAEALAQAEIDAAKSGIDRMMARLAGKSYVPLSERVYNSSVAVQGMIDNLVNSALSRGLSAREFANEAKPFINPDTPGGLRYASMRLARTEINNAAHAVSVDMFSKYPWVERVKWNLSGSHPKPDICNELASGGYKGRGEYAPEDVPAKPHPQCFCFTTPVTPGDDEFLDNLLDGRYDDYLEKYRTPVRTTFGGR